MAIGFVSPALRPLRKRQPFHRRKNTVCAADGPVSPTRRELLQAFAVAPLASLATASESALASETRPRSPWDRLYDSRSGSFVPASALAALLRRDVGQSFNRCIVAGEIHDNICTHAAQLAVIDGATRLPDAMPLTVGFEQFYRMHNMYLDAFIERKISTGELLQKTRWAETWGFDPKLYTPIFEYCRDNQIPMVGLNVPIQFVKEVSNYGLAGLPEGLKQFLPDNMDVGNKEHYRHFMQLIGVDSSHFGANPDQALVDRYYEAQVLWEEWMSQSVAMSLKDRPGTRMVALIGSGHVEGRYGFPDRIERRSAERPYTVVPRPVAWTSNEGHSMPNISRPEADIADLVWYTRRKIDLV